MFLTFDDLCGIISLIAAIAFFIGYRCGKSDQRDAEHRARVTEACNRQLNAIRGRDGN